MGLETSLILLTSIILFILSPSILQVRILNSVYHSGAWESRAETISQLLIGYGFLFLILAIVSFESHNRGRSLTSMIIGGIKNSALALKKEFISLFEYHNRPGFFLFWPFFALIIGASVRGYFLSQPMRGDEAFTFLNFVNKGFISLFEYPVPNNHVFNTLLIKICTLIWDASPATIRIPAFLAGIAIIPLTYYLARAQNPRKYSGVLSALAAALFPYLILYSTNARGYTLVTLLTVSIAVVALRYAKQPSGLGVVLLSVLSALGMWTIPSMIFGIAGLFCWLISLLLLGKHPFKSILYEFAIPFGFLSAAFTIVLYTPVIIVSNGIKPIIANKFVDSEDWPVFFSQFIPSIQHTFLELSRDIPSFVLIIGLALIAFGLYCSLRNRDLNTFLLLPCIVFGALIIIFVQHTLPYARLWIYTLPFIFVVADYGFSYVIEKLIPRLRILVTVALMLIGIIYAVHLISANIIAKYPDTSAFPEAPIVVQYLKPLLTKADNVRVSNTANWSTFFYFWYYDVPFPEKNEHTRSNKTFIIVKKSRYSVEDMTDKPVIKLLDFEDMALYQEVEQ